MNKKVLFFADPHPIRNTFIEFASAAIKLSAIAQEKEFSDIEWRVFSNEHILDILAGECAPENILRPSAEISETIASFFSEWNDKNIAARTDLINGNGLYASFYYDVLTWIHSLFDFTHIVLWSENGAVKNYCQDHGVGIVHVELGPTRKPFQETIYLDPFGTNGNNFLNQLQANEDAIKINRALDTWVKFPSQDRNTPHINELSLLPLPEDYLRLYYKKYVVVALQLSDDLNMIMNSDFDSPKDFLEFIIHDLIKNGYHVLIKGHPAAPTRAINLVREVEALNFASTFKDNVTILDRKLSSKFFIPILSNASAVLSINSSVSFESWLLGIPGFIFGSSSYDINGELAVSSYNFIKEDRIEYDNKELYYSFLLQHYFLPNNTSFIANILSKMIKNYDFNSTKAGYLEWLTKTVDTLNIDIEAEKEKFDWNNRKQKLALSANVDSTKYRFNIEQKDYIESNFIIKGWVGRLDMLDSHPVEAAIVYDGRIIDIQPLNERLDVRAEYPQINQKCGFYFKFNSHEILNPHKLGVAVIDPVSAVVIPLFMQTGKLQRLRIQVCRTANRLLNKMRLQ